MHLVGYISLFLPCLLLLFFPQLFVRPPQTTILCSCISFSLGWFWSLLPVQCYEPLSIVLLPLCLPDLTPWIYSSLSPYNHKGFDLVTSEWPSGFPYCLQFKSEFCNIRSSWSEPQSAPSLVFCWLYSASPSLTEKNIINLISVLTDWWCPCVELCCWKSVFAMINVFSWQNSVNLCPASFCTPRPNLSVIPAIFWLPTSAFQSPMMKRTYFLVLVLEGVVGLHKIDQL